MSTAPAESTTVVEYQPDDATEAIQAALDGPSKEVIIPYVGRPWTVQPLHLRSNKSVVIQPNVILAAKPDSFHGKYDCLLRGDEVFNCSIHAFGAILRMRRDDYTNPDNYDVSEHRHCLGLFSCRNIAVYGLSAQAAGGDGIYVGSVFQTTRKPSDRVSIKDCHCQDNYSQGMSIVSGVDIDVSRCTFEASVGTPPQCGLDIEPAFPEDKVDHVAIIACRASYCRGGGFSIQLQALTAASNVFHIILQSCWTAHQSSHSLLTVLPPYHQPRGIINLSDCVFEASNGFAWYGRWPLASEVDLRLDNCTWSRLDGKHPTVALERSASQGLIQADSIQFDSCTLLHPEPTQ